MPQVDSLGKWCPPPPPPMMLSYPKRNILPLLIYFQAQKETKISYPSKNSRHLPYPIPDAIGIKLKTKSLHPLVARFSLLQNCKHYKKSSHPANVIEYSLFVTLGKDSNPPIKRKPAVTQNLSLCCSLHFSGGYSMTVDGCDDFLKCLRSFGGEKIWRLMDIDAIVHLRLVVRCVFILYEVEVCGL